MPIEFYWGMIWNDKYIVTAHNVNKTIKISYEDSRKILKHIMSAYSSNVAKNN